MPPEQNLNSPIPEYVEARIRQRPRDGLPILPGSTPVVSFGDVRKASVATLGLNPSDREFRQGGKNRPELRRIDQRLETLASLGTDDLSSASSDLICRVFQACNGYFQKTPFGNPYRGWFDVLDGILKATLLKVSYYDGTACHLDLVQWATSDKWSDLDRYDKQVLIDDDLPFLKQQLSLEHIRVLFLNGTGVVTQCRELQACALNERPAIPVADSIELKLSVGSVRHGAKVIGWNKNIQSERKFQNDPQLQVLYVEALIIAINTELQKS